MMSKWTERAQTIPCVEKHCIAGMRYYEIIKHPHVHFSDEGANWLWKVAFIISFRFLIYDCCLASISVCKYDLFRKIDSFSIVHKTATKICTKCQCCFSCMKTIKDHEEKYIYIKRERERERREKKREREKKIRGWRIWGMNGDEAKRNASGAHKFRTTYRYAQCSFTIQLLTLLL